MCSCAIADLRTLLAAYRAGRAPGAGNDKHRRYDAGRLACKSERIPEGRNVGDPNAIRLLGLSLAKDVVTASNKGWFQVSGGVLPAGESG